MVSSSFPRSEKDWKSVFIKQLLGSISCNPSVQMNYWGPPGELPDGVCYACTPSEKEWLDELMAKGGLVHVFKKGGISALVTPFKFLALLKGGYARQQHADVYHVNWLQNALPLQSGTQPLAVSVLGSDLGLLKLPIMTRLLRSVFKKRRCILTPNANWMIPKLEKSFGDVAEVIPVPFGIDADWFDLYKKREPSTPRKWLVVARLTRDKIGPLFDWGEAIFSQSTEQELHLFGPMQEDITLPNWVHYHGPTYPQMLKEKWFPCATGLITVSQHDEGRPQVMLEAMAAGLPIIASNMPAHRDFIKHGETGWLADSPKLFADGIQHLSNPQNNQIIAETAQVWVKKEVGTWADCAGRYLDIYHKLLGLQG